MLSLHYLAYGNIILFVYLLEAEVILQLIWKHFPYHHHFHTDYENPSVETKSTKINDNST